MTLFTGADSGPMVLVINPSLWSGLAFVVVFWSYCRLVVAVRALTTHFLRLFDPVIPTKLGRQSSTICCCIPTTSQRIQGMLTSTLSIAPDQVMENSVALQSPLASVPAMRRVSFDSIHLTSLDRMLAIVSDDDDDDSLYDLKRRSPSPDKSMTSSRKRRRSQRQPSTNKMLRFAMEPQVITTNTAPKEYGETNNASWYSREELTTMKANCRRLATAASISLKDEVFDLHNSGDKVDTRPMFSEEFQYRRGLERWSSALNYQSRALDVLQSKTAVFLEQTNQQILPQKSSSTRDAADILAAAYRENTLKAKHFARALAKADEQAVL